VSFDKIIIFAFMAAMRLLFVFALLGGCTSISDMRERDPRATYSSARAPLDLARCFGSEIRGHGPAQIWPAENETTVSFRPEGNTVLLISIKPNGAGSAVTVWQALGYMARDAVERCV
jgi:hypothetical protein